MTNSRSEAFATLQNILQDQQLDGMWVTSFDLFMSEYTPRVECHRTALSGFTGSMAELLVPREGKMRLYVDGRYHEQADKEVDASVVEVVKCPYGVDIQQALKDDLRLRGMQKLAVEASRFPWKVSRELERAGCEISFLDESMLSEKLGFERLQNEAPLRFLDPSLSGKTSFEKCQELMHSGDALLLSALDSVSWLCNMRSLHRPYQNTAAAICLASRDRIRVLLYSETPAPSGHEECLEFVHGDLSDKTFIQQQFQIFKDDQRIERIQVYSESLNSLWGQIVTEVFQDKVVVKPLSSWPLHFQKNPIEIEGFEKSFTRSNQAIADVLNKVHAHLQGGHEMSERDLYDWTEESYRQQKAYCQSFHTIAGVGENGSIIHYSSSSPQRKVAPSELMLLDSGAYFEHGLATDTTRTILSYGEAHAWQKEIYTLVLKGLIQASMAVVPVGTWGCVVDGLARAPLRASGYDYAHGTGHGVGILVHEGGYRLSPVSQTPLIAGVVGSIEPGIYLPGKGGVRLENIVVVEEHPQFKGQLCFRSLTYVGFDQRLIDQDMLSPREISWLSDYEKECQRLGTSFKA